MAAALSAFGAFLGLDFGLGELNDGNLMGLTVLIWGTTEEVGLTW